MRGSLSALLLFAAIVSSGCGEALPSPPSPPSNVTLVGPHEGTAYALPEGLGYVEFVNEPIPEGRDSSPTSVVVYYLGPDAKSSLNPAPAEAKLRVESRSKRGQAVVLKPAPKADDLAGAGRFTSQPGPYRLDDLRGELTTMIGGKPRSVTFSPR